MPTKLWVRNKSGSERVPISSIYCLFLLYCCFCTEKSITLVAFQFSKRKIALPKYFLKYSLLILFVNFVFQCCVEVSSETEAKENIGKVKLVMSIDGVDLPSRRCKCVKSSTRTEDSLWSWLVLFCAFLFHVFIHGSLASFGIFYPALLAEFGQDKSHNRFEKFLSVRHFARPSRS